MAPVEDLSFENNELKSVLGDVSILNNNSSFNERLLSSIVVNEQSTPSRTPLKQRVLSTPQSKSFGTPINRQIKQQIPATMGYNQRQKFDRNQSMLFSQPRPKLQNRLANGSPTPNIERETKESLNEHLSDLLAQQKNLNFELVRIPATGHKSKLRIETTEANLEQVEKQISLTKRKMKQLGCF